MNVAKLATDAKKRLRHKRRAMPKYPINKAAFRKLRSDAGFKTDAAFWRAVIATGYELPIPAVNSDRSQLSKVLSGERRIAAAELASMATILGTTKDNLTIVLGIEPESGLDYVWIWGLIKNGGDVMFAVSPSTLQIGETYSRAVLSHKGHLLRVEDNSMGVRFQINDLVEYGEQRTDYSNLIGQAVVVAFSDGSTKLRYIHDSDRSGFFTFVAVNHEQGFPPQTTDKIRWVALVDAIYLARG